MKPVATQRPRRFKVFNFISRLTRGSRTEASQNYSVNFQKIRSRFYFAPRRFNGVHVYQTNFRESDCQDDRNKFPSNEFHSTLSISRFLNKFHRFRLGPSRNSLDRILTSQPFSTNTISSEITNANTQACFNERSISRLLILETEQSFHANTFTSILGILNFWLISIDCVRCSFLPSVLENRRISMKVVAEDFI